MREILRLAFLSSILGNPVIIAVAALVVAVIILVSALLLFAIAERRNERTRRVQRAKWIGNDRASRGDGTNHRECLLILPGVNNLMPGPPSSSPEAGTHNNRAQHGARRIPLNSSPAPGEHKGPPSSSPQHGDHKGPLPNSPAPTLCHIPPN